MSGVGEPTAVRTLVVLGPLLREARGRLVVCGRRPSGENTLGSGILSVPSLSVLCKTFVTAPFPDRSRVFLEHN